VAKVLPVLLLHGDAEARLLAGAGATLQAALPFRQVRVTSAWATRPDLLAADRPGPPASLRRRGVIPDVDTRTLLAQPYRLVLLSLLHAVAMPVLRHRDGGLFVAHRGVRAGWSPEVAAAVASECVEAPPLSPAEAAAALAPVIDRLQERGAVVAVCNAFRHVAEPLAHRRPVGPPGLRELVRLTNVEAARLSQRTGCFVLDVDRPLAQEGGATLGADCFGGTGRAEELVLDELLTLVFDALPDDAMPTTEEP
jgi:hypothetical protein